MERRSSAHFQSRRLCFVVFVYERWTECFCRVHYCAIESMGDQAAMTVAAPAEGDVAMTEAAPVLEIVKDMTTEYESVGYGNGNAVPRLDGQVRPSVEDVVVEDLIVEDVIGKCVRFLAENYAGSTFCRVCDLRNSHELIVSETESEGLSL